MTDQENMSPQRRNLYSGSNYEREYSYARAVKTGRDIRISGTTGYDYSKDILVAGAREQTFQIFRNVESILAQTQATLRNVVRARIYISHSEDYDTIMTAWAETFTGIDPACTTVQAGLFDPDIKVEIDWDAVLDDVA